MCLRPILCYVGQPRSEVGDKSDKSGRGFLCTDGMQLFGSYSPGQMEWQEKRGGLGPKKEIPQLSAKSITQKKLSQ